MNVLNSLNLLAAGAADTSGEAASGGISDLGLDPLQIAFQAGTFVVLFVLVRKFAFKKITSILDERHDTIERGLSNARKAAEQLENSKVSAEAVLKEARVEADSIIAKAHEETGAMLKEAEDTATKKADKIVADAQSKIEADVIKAKKDLRGELASLVAEATEAVIGEKMDAEKDKQLIERMLKK